MVYPLSLTLGTEDGSAVQKLGVDAVLSAKKVTYPVFVDPDWTATRNARTYVDSGFPTTSYWNGAFSTDSVNVGFLPAAWDTVYGLNHITRGFYQFNTSALAGRVIKQAVMNVTEVWSPSCTARAVSAWVTGGVSSGTTWNAQPAFMQKVATVTTAKGNSSACPARGIGFDMGTTTGWLNSSPQWTVGLRAENESDSLGWKRFANSADLIITYGRAPNTPTMYAVTDGYWAGTSGGAGVPYVTRRNTAEYSVRSGDVDGGTLSVDMSIKNSAGAVVASGVDVGVRWRLFVFALCR